MPIAWQATVVDRLSLQRAVGECAKIGIEHFPPLAVDQCVADSPETIDKYLKARLKHGYPLPSEVISFPRRKFGVRPVVVSSLAGRAIYKALVGNIEDSLPESSRGDDNWKSYKRFGLDSPARYIVEIDIASCYEYIDHDRLLNELVVRTMEPDVSSAIIDYLRTIQGRRLGMPQLSAESDQLADTYLEILERRIRRDGYETRRFADDFRMLANRHEDAGVIIESFSDYARELGLVLSTEKTGYYRRETLARRDIPEDDIIRNYFTNVADAMAQADALLASEYSDDEDEPEIDLSKVEFEAYHQILKDWLVANKRPRGRDTRFSAESLQILIPRCLRLLRNADEPVAGSLLKEIVFDNPSRIESVVKYLLARESTHDEEHASTIRLLMAAKRQTPWSKLWLVHAAKTVATGSRATRNKIDSWLRAQLSDRHELVRAESAWTLARAGEADNEALLSLYQRASELSRPLIGAALAVSDSAPAKVIGAIKNDGPLTGVAVKWATK